MNCLEVVKVMSEGLSGSLLVAKVEGTFWDVYRNFTGVRAAKFLSALPEEKSTVTVEEFIQSFKRE